MLDGLNDKFKVSQDKNKALEIQQMEVLNKNKELLQMLDIIQKQRTSIDRNEVKSLAARIKCNDIGYTLIEHKNHEMIWFQDSLIVNIQEQMNSEWRQLK